MEHFGTFLFYFLRKRSSALYACLVFLGLVPASSAQIAWIQSVGYRSAPLSVPPAGHPGLTLLAPSATGVTFTNTLSEIKASQNQIRLNGSGVALGDVDGDGWCDIFVCSLEGRLALYKNLGGWHFTNIAVVAGLDLPGDFSTGAVFVDVDGDGDLDLLVNGIGTGTRLFLNDGHGHFTRATNSGLAQQFGAMTCTLADIDGNGTLDLYVANYRTNTVRTAGFSLLNINGRKMVQPEDRGHLEITPDGRVLENGDPDILYLNDGKGHFTPIPWNRGAFLEEDGRPVARAPLEWGLTAAFRDLNGDRIPDLYVCNDFHSPDRLWLNDGKGQFRAIPRLALRHTATFSMSVDFADIDRDGLDDFLVSDMTSRVHGRRLMQIAGMAPYDIKVGVFEDRPQLDRTVLQWNRGDGSYAEVAHFAGLENSEWNWSVIFLDVDLDGYEDLLASTGHMFDTQDLDAQAIIQARGPYTQATAPKKLLMLPSLQEPKLAFRNRGDLTFEESGAQWGFNQVGVSHGMALADLDNDGDLDLVINNLNAPLGLYRNNCNAPRVSVRLKGAPPNTSGIGARVTVTGGPVEQSQEIMSGGRYLSSDDPARVFAAGSATGLGIQVHWRSGRVSRIDDAKPNWIYEIAESTGPTADKPASPRNSPALFEDVSSLLNHTHHEEPFNDFQRQPLLPNRLSQLGPGVCWFDVNVDGWEDLLIGTGKGGQLACYLNDGKGGFKIENQAPWTNSVSRDQTTIAGWGTGGVLVGSAVYEEDSSGGSAVDLYQMGQAGPIPMVPAWDSSVGALAMADYNGDGVLDLFMGGRVIAGKYPASAGSRLYRQVNGRLELDAENSAVLRNVGLVSGAVWSDLDGDGWPDLVLACEWGPLRVIKNDHGRLTPANLPVTLNSSSPLNVQRSTLNDLTGWWNGVTTADLDGDGRPDIVASNWGRNTKYRASFASPRRIYYGDFLQDGSVVPIEACLDEASGHEVPDLDLSALASGLPWILSKFTSYSAFGKSSMADVLGSALSSASKVEVVTLDSMVFLNRTNGWLAVPLPQVAQFATAMAVAVGDFNGDGAEDIFLSQNFFATGPKTPRCDAGRGLLLKGDGKGGVQSVSGEFSGIAVYGEQRGAAVADYDHDGRADLVVTQNGAATRLFHNLGAKPGLRVRLAGPPGNPSGVGAAIRLRFGEHWGPTREVHAGSGYWSQDSAMQVMGTPEPPTAVWVRWPGGRVTESQVPMGAREIAVESDGRIVPGR